ncbi:MAG: L-2-amino-thiazoline-4-carboxylic acid hydrolase [Treponema sp.]|nr:L-2-amino-thiazoline-4-carboxylic acid hydrolase [Treponema sp.]
MTVKNEPKNKSWLIRQLRNFFEHRALWLYLLCDEAKKKGFYPESFAPDAIRRCGLFQGGVIAETAARAGAGKPSLKTLRKKLFGLPGRLIFEMKIRRVTDDNFDVDFHYCPLVNAWQKQGCSVEEMTRLCDFAMCGDRGIAESFGCALDLQKTIAKGDGICEIRFKRP